MCITFIPLADSTKFQVSYSLHFRIEDTESKQLHGMPVVTGSKKDSLSFHLRALIYEPDHLNELVQGQEGLS